MISPIATAIPRLMEPEGINWNLANGHTKPAADGLIVDAVNSPTIEPTKIEFPNLLDAPAEATPAPSPHSESRGLGFLMGGPLVLPPHWLIAGQEESD